MKQHRLKPAPKSQVQEREQALGGRPELKERKLEKAPKFLVREQEQTLHGLAQKHPAQRREMVHGCEPQQ